MGLQKFSAKTFSGEHNRLDQASILAEADSPVLFSRVIYKGFSFPEKTKSFCFLRFCFFAFSYLKKKAKDAGGWHSWFPGRGSNPCGIFA